MEFFNWTTLATYAGALSAVMIITQFTKGLQFIEKIPTQIWSYVISLVVLYPAYFFTGQLDLSAAAIIPFNAVILSLASNGGFSAAKRIADAVKS